MKKNWKILLGLTVLCHLFLLIKLKFTAWPEMLLWPYLLIHGWLPYQNIAIAHTPLLIFDLALFFKVFGVGIIQLKIFTWILIIFLDGLIFWIVKKLWDERLAFVSIGAFAFWQLFFDGNGLWFDIYMSFFALLAFYFTKKRNWFLVGLTWALAFISKQTSVWFLFPIGLELIKPVKNAILKLRILNFIKGVLVIAIPFLIVLWGLGILGDFWNWAIKFGIFILPKAQGQIQLPTIKNLMVSFFPFLIFIPLLSKKGNWNLAVWAIAGIMGAYPRFEYFHFQASLPYLAVATSMVLTNFPKRAFIIKIFIPVYVLGSIYLFTGFFMRNFGEGTRFFEQDVADITAYVKNNTQTNDNIFVMNWWDNIYPLTNTFPSINPWMPQLSWYMEIPGIQDKIVTDLKKAKPKMILVNPYTQVGLSSYKPIKVYDYVVQNYKLKERVDGIEIFIPIK